MMERVGESLRGGSGGDWGHFRESGQRPLSEVMSELKFEKFSINPRSGERAFQKLCWPWQMCRVLCRCKGKLFFLK